MIKLVWTMQGQVIGDFTETHEGWKVENPVFVSPGPQGLNMMPVLMFSTDSTVTLLNEDIKFNGQLFEPLPELRNAYSSQFGSGLQLLTG